MSGLWLVLAAAVMAVGLCGAVARAAGPEVLVAGDAHGLAFARGQAGSHGPASKVQLLFHNGAIMTSASVQAIFWGTSWSNSTFVSDKITGLTSFYNGIGGSRYIATNTEYTGTNGQVTTAVTNGASVTDLTPAGSRDPGSSGVLAEVARTIAHPVANGYYPVYTDIPRGSAGYCAWHSYGTINGTPVQFAFFFNLDGDSGCDPGSTVAGHSQGVAALANVSGHELSEALTDPRNGGWYDSRGAENADKCAWTFNGDEPLNGSTWKIQGNWSNAAYNAKSGYTAGGCINGN
jgi:hypothetical protein